MKRSTPFLPWEEFFDEAWIRPDRLGPNQVAYCPDLKESNALLFFDPIVVSQLFLSKSQLKVNVRGKEKKKPIRLIVTYIKGLDGSNVWVYEIESILWCFGCVHMMNCFRFESYFRVAYVVFIFYTLESWG